MVLINRYTHLSPTFINTKLAFSETLVKFFLMKLLHFGNVWERLGIIGNAWEFFGFLPRIFLLSS